MVIRHRSELGLISHLSYCVHDLTIVNSLWKKGIGHKVFFFDDSSINKNTGFILWDCFQDHMWDISSWLHCFFFFFFFMFIINSVWPSDNIWRYRSGSTLAQVMACGLKAPEPMLTSVHGIHYSSHSNCTDEVLTNLTRNMCSEIVFLKIFIIYCWGQWVDPWPCSDATISWNKGKLYIA